MRKKNGGFIRSTLLEAPNIRNNACRDGCIFNPRTRRLTQDTMIILQILTYINSNSKNANNLAENKRTALLVILAHLTFKIQRDIVYV